MMKTLHSILQKFLHTFKSPVLFTNTSYQIDSINYTIEKTEDEQSTNKGNRFITSVKSELGEYRKLKYKLIKKSKEKTYFFITMKKQTVDSIQKEKRKKEKFYSMFNDITNGIIFIKTNGEIVEMNEPALRYLQCKRDQLINKQHEVIFEFVNDYNMGKNQYLSSFKNNQCASIQVSLTNNMDEIIYLKIDSKFNKTLNLFTTTITDVTETILLKEQIEQQDSLKTIGQMAANIAHEIRNPMTSLKGFVQLLKVNSSDVNQGYLKVIDSELDRMESILTAILEISKPEGTSENFVNLQLDQVVQEVMELMTPSVSDANIQIEFEYNEFAGDYISGNKNRLKQLLINLMKNAIEVMPNGGKILIQLASSQEQVQLYVIDNGPGISPEKIDLLFTPFYTTKDSGTGLGLSLVKTIVEQHKGYIDVSSTVGVGTTFRMSFPIVENDFGSIQENMIDEWIDEGDVKSLSVI